MATLKLATFPSDKSGQLLLGKVKDALANLTGIRGGSTGVSLCGSMPIATPASS